MIDEGISQNNKCCMNCAWFDRRTKFCRFNPPQPVVFYDEVDGTKVSSKFSVICQPTLDWCSHFQKQMIIEG